MKVGDKIVYPMHGAGEVVGIEEKEVNGEKQSYYTLNLSMGNLRLMLPVEQVEAMGLRKIIDKEQTSAVAEVLAGKSDDSVGSWNKRFHATLDRLKTGDILEVAAVARNITRQSLKRKISSGERRLMELSRQILISELVFVFNKDSEEVSNWIDENIKRNIADNEE
ncbi:MAG: CarD family transcriptional regulator [Selenomonadaceae bacterium]|nr:CarD family transcriptional regulator [Selenomonadaceae bacterium]